MEKPEKVTRDTLPEALGAYAAQKPARFHMPGHKARGMGGFWRDELIGWDVTELSGTDNLHAPSGAILAAQARLAGAYGAAHSFMSVNGSTAAVQAMLLSLAPDDVLLLSRDAHRSAVSGAALAGLSTHFITPAYDVENDLVGMVTPEALDAALTNTGATAVLITSPNYLGLCADLSALSCCAKAHGALLLVDAAHGAHFAFSEALPPGAAGSADMWAHSQHKTLNALTQAASLHLGDCRIPPARVLRALAMVETTSPSYLLMASIDWSVHMARRQNWTAQVRRCQALEREIAALPGLSVLPGQMGAGVAARDYTRLVIDVSGRGLSGYEAQALLEKDGIFIEMADARRLVLITTPSDDPCWYPRLMQALGGLPRAGGRFRPLPPVYAQGAARLPIREAMFSGQQSLPLAEAVGRVAGEPFGIYPPGVAACMPGEEITLPLVEGLRLAGESGAAFFGIREGCVSVVED